MKKLGFIFFLFILVVGCSKKIPDYVIPHNDMVNIIVDIHITDGLLTINNVRRQIATEDSTNIYNQVLQHYGYTRKDFDTSLYYYSRNINEYDKIYGEVLNKLSEMETGIKEEQQKEQAKDTL